MISINMQYTKVWYLHVDVTNLFSKHFEYDADIIHPVFFGCPEKFRIYPQISCWNCLKLLCRKYCFAHVSHKSSGWLQVLQKCVALTCKLSSEQGLQNSPVFSTLFILPWKNTEYKLFNKIKLKPLEFAKYL